MSVPASGDRLSYTSSIGVHPSFLVGVRSLRLRSPRGAALGPTRPWSHAMEPGGVKPRDFYLEKCRAVPVTERELSGLCQMMFVDVCVFNHLEGEQSLVTDSSDVMATQW